MADSVLTLDYTHEEGNDYNTRKQKEADAWEAIRDQLLKVSIEASCLPSTAKCCECEEPASIRCKECGMYGAHTQPETHLAYPRDMEGTYFLVTQLYINHISICIYI